MSKREAKVRSTMELPEAVAYVEDVLKKLKAGDLNVMNGAQDLRLTPQPSVKLEFEATQKSDKESISLKLSWRLEERAKAGKNGKNGKSEKKSKSDEAKSDRAEETAGT